MHSEDEERYRDTASGLSWCQNEEHIVVNEPSNGSLERPGMVIVFYTGTEILRHQNIVKKRGQKKPNVKFILVT